MYPTFSTVTNLKEYEEYVNKIKIMNTNKTIWKDSLNIDVNTPIIKENEIFNMEILSNKVIENDKVVMIKRPTVMEDTKSNMMTTTVNVKAKKKKKAKK